MSGNETIVKFNNVSFQWESNKPILDEANFSLRRGSKITLMGQNGAGKSTIFHLIMGQTEVESGSINLSGNITIASARQVIPRSELDLTVTEFFKKCFSAKIYNIDVKIKDVLEVVNLAI